MPTADRRGFVPAAIRLFLDQDYANKELLIVDDGTDRVEDIVPKHSKIRYIGLPDRQRLGSKRNVACEAARGDIILHWDDDDWHAPWRVSYQVEALVTGNLDLCGLDRAFFVDGEARQAWEYVHPRSSVPWVCGATLCYRKAFWNSHRFADVAVGEDSRFVFSNRGARITVLEDNWFFVARIHDRNTCRKWTRDARWEQRSIDSLRSVVGIAWEEYFGGPSGLPKCA
jgi:O-antigen biosynthesis protein